MFGVHVVNLLSLSTLLLCNHEINHLGSVTWLNLGLNQTVRLLPLPDWCYLHGYSSNIIASYKNYTNYITLEELKAQDQRKQINKMTSISNQELGSSPTCPSAGINRIAKYIYNHAQHSEMSNSCPALSSPPIP